MSRSESKPSRNTDPVNAAILGALAEVRRRLRLNFALRDGLLLAALVVLGLLAWRLLHVFGDNAPAASALTILIALLLAMGIVLRLGANRLRARVTLAHAATVADARAGLRDELSTAYWFSSQAQSSPWVSAQAARAARSVEQLEGARVVPLRLPAAGSAALAGGLVALALAWTITPLAALEPGRLGHAQLSPDQARQIETIRALIGQTPGDEAARKLEQALRTLERKEASPQEKRLALEQVQEAVEQRTLEAASAREGLQRLAAHVRSAQGMEEVAAALDQGDAKAAVRRPEKLAGARLGESAAGRAALDAERAAREKNLERLLQEAAAAGGKRLEQRQAAAAAMKEAVDRLKKISEQLEVQGRLSESAQSLQQFQQLAVAQRSAVVGRALRAAGGAVQHARARKRQHGHARRRHVPLGRGGAGNATFATAGEQQDRRCPGRLASPIPCWGRRPRAWKCSSGAR